MNELINTLILVKNTINKTHVSVEESINLLGCIQALDTVIKELSKKGEEDGNVDKN